MQEREDPSSQLAIATRQYGRSYLLSDLPNTYIKANWYESQVLHQVLLGSSILMLLIALWNWAYALMRDLFKHEKQPWAAYMARLSGIVFALLMLTFLIGFAAIATDTEPVSGNPKFLFELPGLLPFVLVLPLLMALTGLALLAFMPLI